MFAIFTHPEFLAVAAAAVSVPIVIHLINRMRFKRIRWAAMEFLLKAMKRTRRKLIIEQLLLLALRCLLVALVGLLVMRFVGFSFADLGGRQAVHIVLLDDTLSMADQWKDKNPRGAESLRGALGRGEDTNAYEVAVDDILWQKIAKGLSESGGGEELVIVPLSALAVDTEFQPLVHERLNDQGRLNALAKVLTQMILEGPSKVHADLLPALKYTEGLTANYPGRTVTLHVLSDFRQQQWALPGGEGLYRQLLKMVKDNPELKVRPVDCAYPFRLDGQAGYPLAQDNIGIVDFRAGTRVVGKDMPVQFTLTLANFSSREAEVNLVVQDDAGQDMLQLDFNPPMPLKLPAGKLDQTVTFEARFSPTIRAGEIHYATISARLESAARGKLENDGLLEDNHRHATVEVRDQVPVLVVDGGGARRPADRDKWDTQDWFFLETAIRSVPGSSYRIVYGDELGGGVPTKALERPDLWQYPSIFLLNVRELNPKQLANLRQYVQDGGGVGFFLGPLVDAHWYAKNLYENGKGLFPAPLKEPYFPAPTAPELAPEYTGDYHLLLREDLYPTTESYPIFGPVFKDKGQREHLKDLPVRRYFQVPRADWRSEPGRSFELATLPNDQPATAFQRAALDLVRGPAIEKLLEQDDYKGYRRGIERHRRAIEAVVAPTSEKKAHHLATALDALLNDKGKPKEAADHPNLTEFFSAADPKVRSLRDDIRRLVEQTRYGDAFVVGGTYGKGKVVAVMSTAGKTWNDWGGGSGATLVYQPFIWEMQNWLSSQGSETNRTVGTPIRLSLDAEGLKKNAGLKMQWKFHQPLPGDRTKVSVLDNQFPKEAKGMLDFRWDRTLVPGLYVGLLQNDEGRQLAGYSFMCNVDAHKEGPLARIGSDDMDKNLVREAPPGSVRFGGPGIQTEELVTRQTDLSESPWFYLLFLCVLIAEQALAVHLSFHMRGSESDRLGRAPAVPQGQAA